MAFVFDHMLPVSALIVAAGVALAVMVFWGSLKVLGDHPAAAAGGSVGVSLVIGILFTVLINQLWAGARDRNQRFAVRRSQHLDRLRPVLRTEGERLRSFAGLLRTNGYLQTGQDIQRLGIWPEDILAPDLDSHFPEYFGRKEQLLKDVLVHDQLRQTLVADLMTSLPIKQAAEGYRAPLVATLAAKCVGIPADVVLTVNGTSFSFSAVGAGAGGSASPELIAAMQAAVESFRTLTLSHEQSTMCQQLRAENVRLAAEFEQLGMTAMRAAEITVLRGDCEYVPRD